MCLEKTAVKHPPPIACAQQTVIFGSEKRVSVIAVLL